jgi:hypothetical protein
MIYYDEAVVIFDSYYIISVNYNSSGYRGLAKFGFQILDNFLVDLKLAADNVNLLLEIVYMRNHNLCSNK